VAFTPGKDFLVPRECALPSKREFLTIESSKDGYLIELELSDTISGDLRNCLQKKDEILALRVNLLQMHHSSTEVQLKQAAIIPLFDNSQGTPLTEPRTESILGELRATLKIDQLSCEKRVIYQREPVTCRATVQNASSYNVFGGIVITLREVLPPGITNYEKIERTNLLLVPGQTYTLSFPLPLEKIAFLGNTISVHTTFSSIGEDASGFTATRESALYYLPLQALIGVGTLLCIFSAILIRKLWIKFTR
jgi:hypothetical protein